MFGSFLLSSVLAAGQAAPSAPSAPLPTTPTSGAPVASKPAPVAGPVVSGPVGEVAPAPSSGDAEKYAFMRSLEGTKAGQTMEQHGLFITGWVAGSYNFSSAAQSNSPLAWTDRSNEPMLQQAWVRFGKAIDTKKDEFQLGFQADFLYGSDYRFTLPRGLLNGQLQNANGNQNIYGFDPIQHYIAAYVPGLFEGTEFRVGRVYTPWGVESLEAVSTPLITRSYAFNSSPPFTHSGVAAYVNFSKELSGTFMVANGNDIYFGASGQDWRGVGAVKWTSPDDGKTTVTFATSLGRGAFNAGSPYLAPTAALATEPFGRNNFNAFDLVVTRSINEQLSTAVELIYGYQSNVPAAAAPGKAGNGSGTAQWASAAGYLFYKLSDEITLTTRLEGFNDFQGQRTGFEGLYLSATTGVSFKPAPGLIFRTEARYDYNIETRPFEGDPGIFVLAAELIFRF